MEKGERFALLVGMQTGADTVESSMEMPQKIKNEPVFNTVIPLLGIYPETQNTDAKEHKHVYIHCSIIYNHQDTEAA